MFLFLLDLERMRPLALSHGIYIQISRCKEAVKLLDSIPGVARRTAELLLAEIGLDMSRFPTAGHLAKWARLCPGNYESAGKRLSGTTGSGNQWLRSGLVQAAQAAVRCKGTYLASLFRRLASRRGRNKAIVAVAHRLLKAAYYILSKREPYKDLPLFCHSRQRKIGNLSLVKAEELHRESNS